MTNHHDIVHGGGGAVALGWAVSLWAWLTGGMAPLAVLATLMTIALTGLKLWDAIKRRRRGKPLNTEPGAL